MDFDIDVCNTLSRNFALNHSDENLKIIRDYLDSCGMYMPLPKFKYDEEDISTHKFLEGKVIHNEKYNTYRYVNIYNPNFKYGLIV